MYLQLNNVILEHACTGLLLTGSTLILVVEKILQHRQWKQAHKNVHVGAIPTKICSS